MNLDDLDFPPSTATAWPKAAQAARSVADETKHVQDELRKTDPGGSSEAMSRHLAQLALLALGPGARATAQTLRAARPADSENDREAVA